MCLLSCHLLYDDGIVAVKKSCSKKWKMHYSLKCCIKEGSIWIGNVSPIYRTSKYKVSGYERRAGEKILGHRLTLSGS